MTAGGDRDSEMDGERKKSGGVERYIFLPVGSG